jgi:hypothetical protein
MFRFTCPICRHGLKARESLAGKNVRCPGCGNVITVPEPPASPDDPARPPAPLPPAFESQPVPPIEGPGRADENPTRPAPSHPDTFEGEEPGHGAGASEGAAPPAVPTPHAPLVIVAEPPPPIIVVPVPVPVMVATPPDEPAIPGEPLPASSGSPGAVAVAGVNHEAGGTEQVPAPTSPSSAPPPAVVVEPLSPARSLSEAALMAHHLSATGVRTEYFAPAGYAGPDRFAVPFLAPDLRRRLGQVPDAPEPPQNPSPPGEPAADWSAYLVTRTPRWGAVASHTAPADGAVPVIDPVLAGVFLTHGEADPRVPRAAVRVYLEDPRLLAAATELRDRAIRNWDSGGPPLKPDDLLAIARDLVDDAPTALLLCHNVTRAFAHGSMALSWHLLDSARGEYTDGATVYTAAIRHPEGVPGPSDNPLFFLLFAADSLGPASPWRWVRHFALATAAAYAAAARLAPADAPATPFALAWTREVEEASGSMVDRSQSPSRGYRAWLWAGALGSVSLSGLPPGSEEWGDAALADLRAAAFGLAQVGVGVDFAWAWPEPSADDRRRPARDPR